MRERIRSDLLTVKLNYRAEYAVQNSLMISLWRRYRGSGTYFCIRYVGNCNNKLLSGAKGPIQHLCWPDSASKAKSHSADRSKTHIWYSVSVKWEDQMSNGEIRELYVEYQPRRFNKWAVECVKKGSGRDDACHKFCTNAFSFSPHCFLFFSLWFRWYMICTEISEVRNKQSIVFDGLDVLLLSARLLSCNTESHPG